MNKEQKFYETLQDVFIGAKIEGEVRTPRLPSADTPLRDGNYEREFEDGTKINYKDPDYILIKSLICWE